MTFPAVELVTRYLFHSTDDVAIQIFTLFSSSGVIPQQQKCSRKCNCKAPDPVQQGHKIIPHDQQTINLTATESGSICYLDIIRSTAFMHIQYLIFSISD